MSKSTSETGHAVNINNFKLLADTVTGFGDNYNPSNEDITIENLLALWTKAKTANETLSEADQGMKEPINQRAILFSTLDILITQVMGAVDSSKANALVKKDAKGLADRIRGFIKKTKKGEEIPTPEEPIDKVSQSHQGYVQRATTFGDLINLLKTIAEYKPNEKPLQVASLTALQTKMQAANDGIGAILQTGEKAELERNRTLYKPETGMLDLAQVVRDYVKSVFSSKAAEYKQVTAIKFRDLPKKEKEKL